MNRAFKVIQGHPYWCRQESRTVCCVVVTRNVQLMPTLFLKLMKMWQRENSKFVDFNDPTQVKGKLHLDELMFGLFCCLVCRAAEQLDELDFEDSTLKVSKRVHSRSFAYTSC